MAKGAFVLVREKHDVLVAGIGGSFLFSSLSTVKVSCNACWRSSPHDCLLALFNKGKKHSNYFVQICIRKNLVCIPVSCCPCRALHLMAALCLGENCNYMPQEVPCVQQSQSYALYICLSVAICINVPPSFAPNYSCPFLVLSVYWQQCFSENFTCNRKRNQCSCYQCHYY